MTRNLTLISIAAVVCLITLDMNICNAKQKNLFAPAHMIITDTLSDADEDEADASEDDNSTDQEEIEKQYNRIITTIDARSHNTYRGRDGGISQAAVSPSVALALSSGLRFSVGAIWTEKPEFHRDGTNLGIGYDFQVGPSLSASVGYSYLSYADSSVENQSVFSHSIDGGVLFNSDFVNLGANLSFLFGTELEYALALSISKSISIGIISFDPSATVTWGEQNGILVAERLFKTNNGNGKSQGKGKGAGNNQQSSVFNNIFTLMSYEINLPVSIQLKNLTLTPVVSAIFPMNVIDGSREVPYLNAGLTVSYELNLQN